MQARLQSPKSPTFLATAAFGLVAAVTLGGGLGYVLRPAATVPGPERVVVVHDNTGGAGASGADCIRTNDHKAC